MQNTNLELTPLLTRPDVRLVGLDLETTGLNTYLTLNDDIELTDGTKFLKGQRVHGALFHDILSCGVVIPNSDGSVKATFHAGVRYNEDMSKKMDPKVLEMHTKSGLIDQLKTGDGFDVMANSASELADLCLSFMLANGCTKYSRDRETNSESGTMYFGNTFGFDLAFIDAQMPELYKFGSYRSLDVSSINILGKLPAVESLQLKTVKKLYAHTAQEDILETLSELNCYTSQLNDLKARSESVGITLNHFDDDGAVVATSDIQLSHDQVSDIVGHATQLVQALESNSMKRLSQEESLFLGELREALTAYRVIHLESSN